MMSWLDSAGYRLVLLMLPQLLLLSEALGLVISMLDYRVCRIILFRTTEVLLYSICWLQESWIFNLSVSFFIVKSDDSVTLGNIKHKNSLAEDTGGTLRRPSAKHAWSKLRKTSRCSIARLFNMKRVITPGNVAFFSVLHVHRLKWPNFTASPRICMRRDSFTKQNITTTCSLYEVKLYLAAAVLCATAGVVFRTRLWKWKVYARLHLVNP